MSKRNLTLITAVLAISLTTFSQHKEFHNKLSLLTEAIQTHHYHPRVLDEAFSQFVYDDILKRLDANCVLFSKEDIQALDSTKDPVEMLITQKDTSFLHHLDSLFHDKISRTINFLQEETDHYPEWKEGDSIWLSDFDHFSTESNRTTKWRKLIRYQTLKSLNSQSDTISAPELAYKSAQLNTIDKYICGYTKILNSSGGTVSYIHHTVLKSIASAFDPHTNYLSDLEGNYFLTYLSKERYSFGLYLNYNEFGQIEVSELTPGGSAWDSNQINVGDVILNIEHNENHINLNCASIELVENVLMSETITEAKFKIRKKSGTELSVDLRKTVLDVEDNVIQSFILEGPKKIGYIYLPSFYSDYSQNNSSNGCSDDIAKEILRLKKEGIDGLIFDVRDNGGGDMNEALKLAGIFINYGALAIVDSKNETPGTLNDKIRGTLFSEPLLILQNKQSASASELFSGTLQDYNRAIIAGSDSYGKATTQTIVPLSSDNASSESNADLLKITVGKFFRVDGSSHQNTGIIPDVYLPFLSTGEPIGEHTNANSLSKTTIDKKAYYYPLDSLPVALLQKSSSDRIQNDTCFTNLQKLNAIIRNLSTSRPLSQNEFDSYYEMIEGLETNYRVKPVEEEIIYSVSMLNSIYGITAKSEGIREATEVIKEDFYIKESYNIITELIKTLETKNQ
jgi:carboxyl-terminal processing protease